MREKLTSKLLGKKRLKDDKEEKSEEEEEEENDEEEEEEINEEALKKYKNLFSNLNEEDEESNESQQSEPVKRLFSDKEIGFSKGLFDNNPTTKKESKIEENKPLFDFSKKFDNKNSLFGNISLFNKEDNEKKEEKNDKNEGKKEENKEENKEEKKIEKKYNKKEEKDEDDNYGKYNNSSRYEYNPQISLKEDDDDNNKYVKRYVKQIDKIFLMDDIEKKFVSKGEGFASIETQTTREEKKEKKNAIFIFRNNIGNLIFEGFLNEKINKIENFEKNDKYIAQFVILMNDKKNKIYMTRSKIYFKNKDDLHEFTNIYNKAIKYINNELKDFSNK